MTILITGSAKGLGFNLTKFFLEKGHTVLSLIKSGNKNLSDLQQKYKNQHFIFICDVGNEQTIIDAYEIIREKITSIDILINNAAVHLESHRPDLPEIDFSVYIPTFTVNALGPLMVVTSFLPLVRAGTGKLIVNISSEAGSIGNSTRKSEFSYCMSKAALNMASKILQNRVAKEGIKVLAIHPGWFSSDMGGPLAPISPRAAAGNVGSIILKKWSLKDPVYIDADGRKIAW
ncbi:MAG: SDR family NAD(P)-dependent oxidoreductase [Spirochaetales bacterium]|nr:SDR family NAD(P)-dependent oxidoreductase [Spirochaetales bacterium]